MSERPLFNDHMSEEDFQKFYWYKRELEIICRRYGLPSFGTKAELSEYIREFLRGIPVKNIKQIRVNRRSTSKKLLAEEIRLDTKLLNSGFSLNNEARKFFADYFGVKKFTFRKSMGIKMREIEKNQDNGATVADLIKSLSSDNKITDENSEEKTYQWNNFVKDFYEDKSSANYQYPIKVAAILWKIVRDSKGDKTYSHKLITDNAQLLEKYNKINHG